MRPIDADKLKFIFQTIPTLDGLGLEPVIAVRDVVEIIDGLPAIDAIPIEWLDKRLTDMLKGSFTKEECETVAAILTDWTKGKDNAE